MPGKESDNLQWLPLERNRSQDRDSTKGFPETTPVVDGQSSTLLPLGDYSSKSSSASTLPHSDTVPEPSSNPHTQISSSSQPQRTTSPETQSFRSSWLALKQAFTIVKEVSDPFFPLKAAVSGLSVVMDHVDEVNDVQTQLVDVAARTQALVGVLTLHQPGDLSPRTRKHIEGLTDVIIIIQNFITEKTKPRNVGERALNASGDVQDIVRAFRTLASLVDTFITDTTLKTDINTEWIRKDATLNELRHVPEASFRARDHGGCMAGTRVAILEDLLAWAINPDSPRIFWLDGMAGTGKSTIALSFSRLLHKNGLLGGSFFCSRQGSVELSNIRRIIPTLARDMARISVSFEAALIRAMKRDSGIADGSLSAQLALLMVDPTGAVLRDHPRVLVFIIDALDECEGKFAAETMLDAIVQHSSSLRVKFFVTSRPDARIRQSLSRLQSILRLREVDAFPVRSDIELYLSTVLRNVPSRRKDFKDLVGDWPPLDRLHTLVNLADKHFIYASTAYEYISDPEFDPQLRLEQLTSITDADGPLMTKTLDGIYSLILSKALGEKRGQDSRDPLRTMAAIVALRNPLSLVDLAHLLNISSTRVRSAVSGLQSLISVPATDEGHISISHASFGDYLTDYERSGLEEWFVDSSQVHRDLSRACIRVMNAGLHFNITGSRTSHVKNRDQLQDFRLAGDLTYACRFWADHVASHGDQEVLQKVEDFLRDKFLFWLEAMSGLGRVHEATTSLRKIATSPTMKSIMTPNLKTLLADANEFMVAFREPITESAPHIYLSALPFAPPDSLITQIFRPLFSNTFVVGSQARNKPPHSIIYIDEHAACVASIAFSPDGKLIVSGSDDETIRLWDAETGEAVFPPFKGHTGPVNVVAFSPDGKYIVSGSDDKTIRVWDTETGEVLSPPFQGHTDAVLSVAFSPDGNRIISGSGDMTIRVWDTETGDVVSLPFEGHTSKVSSVAFSPDGKRIVSGSYDCTIRVWDTETGEAVFLPFKGHAESVCSVAFSPDGKRVVSGSDDATIRVWDTETGEAVSPPFKGHFRTVHSVAFSPDGKRIVSGSHDYTVQVWDIETGDRVYPPFEGHTDTVYFVAFSPDGKRIVSGSNDWTIMVWDIDPGEAVSMPSQKHLQTVTEVAFSPDGKRIVSGSWDETVRVWDAETGELVCPPFQGHTGPVYSVSFSPDGKRIVSGSYDRTIRVWDTDTGNMVSPPLEGHTTHVVSVAFTPDGKRIISGSQDKTIRVWDTETGEVVFPLFQELTNPVLTIALSLDGTRIVCGSFDCTILVWDTETGEAVSPPFTGHTAWVSSVAFSPDGKRIVSGSGDKTIRVWDTDTGKMVSPPFEGHKGVVASVAISPDGKRIVSGSYDNTIQVWDMDTGEVVSPSFNGHTGGIMSVVFSPDGKRIVSGSSDETIRVWNTETYEGAYEAKNEAAQVPTFPSAYTLPNNDSSPFPTASLVNFTSSSPPGQPWDSNTLSYAHPGWAVGSGGELLFWVPPDCRAGFWWPRTVAIMGASKITVDLDRFVHGASWVDCRTEPSTV